MKIISAFSILLVQLALCINESYALPVSCASHGGIACAKGADTDGSVICLDDFRDSNTRYRFYCSSAKLQIDSIKRLPDLSYKILVRNDSQIAARQVNLLFTYSGSKTIRPEITGPQSIEANGLEEYTLLMKGGLSGDESADNLLVLDSLKIKCENCQ